MWMWNEFHSVNNTNHKQRGEILDKDEQIGLNWYSTLILSKVTQQFNFKTPTSSVQHIEQQVERVTQNIVNQLVNHVSQQVGRLEAIVSKNKYLNDNRQNDSKTDRYHPAPVTQDVSGYHDWHMGFHSKTLNSVFLVRRRYPGNTRLALTDGASKWELFSKVMLNLLWEKPS